LEVAALKELAHYLLEHPLLLLLILAAAGVAALIPTLLTDGTTLPDDEGQLPGSSDAPDYDYDLGDTGTHELGGEDGVPDIILSAGGGTPAPPGSYLPEPVEPQKVGPVADVLYAGSAPYCEGDKPHVNLKASFATNEKWLKGDLNTGWSTEGGMECTFVSYDEPTHTALFNCTGEPDSTGLFVLTGTPPVELYFGVCGDSAGEASTDGETAPRREPDCGDRKC
jgi:hypothetical protein